jgi:hypothetical protein
VFARRWSALRLCLLHGVLDPLTCR